MAEVGNEPEISRRGCLDADRQGKKPTKVAVRKIAREARWQQQVDESGLPDSSDNTPTQQERMEEIKQRREKADK